MASRSEQLRNRLQQGESARQRVLSRVYGQSTPQSVTQEPAISPRAQALRNYAAQANEAERQRAAQGVQQMKQLQLDPLSLTRSIEAITAPPGAPVQRPATFMPQQPDSVQAEPSSAVNEYLAQVRQGRADQGVPSWLNNVLGKVDEFLYASPIGRQITGFGQGAAEALTGVSGASGTPQVGSRASRIAGSLASAAVNPAAPETSLIQGGYRVAEGALGTRTGQRAVQGAANLLQRAGIREGAANSVAQNLARGAIAGATQNVAQMAAAGQTSPEQLAENAMVGGALGGAGDALVIAVGPVIGQAFSRFIERSRGVSPELEQATQEAFGNTAIPPSYKSIPTGTLRNASKDAYVNRIITSIRDEVNQLMTPPLENPNELAKWLRPHLGEDVSLNEIRRLPYNDMVQLAEEVRSNMSLYDVANQVAKKRGYDLEGAFAGNRPSFRDRVAADNSRRAYGIYDAPNITPARSIPREGTVRTPEPSLPVEDAGPSAPSAAGDIDMLVQEYRAADEALAELDRRYAAGDSPDPTDVQRMIELEGRKAAAVSRIQQAISAGDRPLSIPEGRIQARAAAAVETPMTAATGSAAATLPEEGIFARVKPPSGPRSAGPTKPTTSKTISRAKLIENIRRNLGVTISSGRTGYNRDQVLGIYKQQPQVIRTGFAEDYDTIAHEIGHDFTKRYKLDDPQFLQELTDMMDAMNVHDYRQYPPSQWLDEGIAEYMRAYLTNPAQARQLAPRFTAYMESKLPKKIQRGLANVQRDIAIWEGQGDYNRAVGKIDFEGGDTKNRASWNKWYTRAVDDLNPIKLIEKALTGTVNIGSKSIYKLARLSRGVGERAKMAITRGIFDDKGKELSVGLRQIVEPIERIGMSEKDFGTYLAVMHAQDLKELEKIIPFSDEEIAAVMERWGDNPVVQKAQQQIVKYNNALLDLMVDAQLLSKEAVAEMRRKYPNYVPFMRYFDDDAVAGFKNGGYGASKGFANITNPVKRMSEEGSERTIINPIESMVKNTFLVMNAAAKNKVGLQLAELAKIDGAGAWVEHVPGASDPKEHIVNVKINGENQAYKIRDPELYNAMLSLDNESVNSLIKFLGGSASLLRAGATLTPEFTIRNAFRDVTGAMINSTKYGFNPLDFFRGFFHVVTKSDVYEKFINSGGAMSTMMALDRDANREALKAIFKLSLKDKALNVVTSPKELAKFLSGYTPLKATVGVLRKGAEISELSTKVGAFNKALQKTGDIEEAAYTARDLMDFNRAGSAVRSANRAVAFLNASIQGTDKMVRAFKDNPASFLTRAFTTLVLPAAAIYFWNRYLLSDEERAAYENIPRWQKDSFFVIGIPGTGEFVRIPKPFEAGMLFATSTERMLDWLEGNDKEAFESYGKATVESMTPPVLFTALTPLLEAITNHSFFRDAPVVPQGEQRFEKKDQYGVYTSELAKEIGQFMDKIGLGNTNAASPRIIDNTIKGYTAGLGQYGVDLADKVIEGVRGSDGVAEPAKKWTEDPFFRSFFVSTAGGGQVRQDFYDKWDKLSAAKASAARNEKKFAQQREYDRMNRYYKQISKLNKQYKEIQQSKTLSAEEKRSKLDALDAKMNAAAAAALGK
jgi:hypothetical protein